MASRRGSSSAAADGPTPGSLAASGAPGDPEKVARTVCLRMLTAAPRTRAELAAALAKKDVPDDVAEQVLDRFVEVGLIDDAAYAEAWVQSRHAGRGLARRALAHELRRRGVAEDDVQTAVERLDPDDERATARALVDRKLPSTRRLDHDRRVRRLVGMLARKGYSSGVAMRVVDEAIAAERVEQ
ncbi:MAG: recombination regulator RecX [Streptosporangiales bacterium]|nr:recombination regulator RecX [Streptosporangiales bacterium]